MFEEYNVFILSLLNVRLYALLSMMSFTKQECSAFCLFI